MNRIPYLGRNPNMDRVTDKDRGVIKLSGKGMDLLVVRARVRGMGDRAEGISIRIQVRDPVLDIGVRIRMEEDTSETLLAVDQAEVDILKWIR